MMLGNGVYGRRFGDTAAFFKVEYTIILLMKLLAKGMIQEEETVESFQFPTASPASSAHSISAV